MKLITLRIKDELAVRLERLSHSQKRPKSEVMREALETFLSSHQRKEREQTSVYELMKDAEGVAKGSQLPRDLASNKKHLKGFGQ